MILFFKTEGRKITLSLRQLSGSEGLVGGWTSPGDAKDNKHQGEEAEGDQADDKRQPGGLVIGARKTWQKNGASITMVVVG